MTLWMVRAGRRGEHEDYALRHAVAVIGWAQLGDLSAISSVEQLKDHLFETYPLARPATLSNWGGQLWAFRARMQIGDLVALPLKTEPAVAFGRVSGDYRYNATAPPSARHQRPVDWIRDDVARLSLDQDLLYSLGASMTVCRIKRNNAEARVRRLLAE